MDDKAFESKILKASIYLGLITSLSCAISIWYFDAAASSAIPSFQIAIFLVGVSKVIAPLRFRFMNCRR